MDNKLSNKLPTELSTEELLKSLDTAPSDEPNNDLTNDVVRFLSHFEVKPGEQHVGSGLLFKLYKSWSKNPVKRRTFANEVGQYLPRHEFVRTLFLVNLSTMKVSQKALDVLAPRKKNKSKSKSYKAHFNKFVSFYSLSPGTRNDGVWLENFVIYHLYDKWTYKNNNKSPLGPKQFKAFMDLNFTHRRRTAKQLVWYRVKKSVLTHLPQEHLDQLRQGQKRGKEEKPKKQTEESCPKASI